MSSNYDLIILGGGPGGYFAAEQAGKAKLKTLCIEKEHMGGVCLNEGCVPTKTLLNSAKIYLHAKDGEDFGVNISEVSLDHPAVIKRKETVIKKLVSGVERSVKGSGTTILKQAGVIKGKSADGYQVEAGGEVYTAKNLIIATGSSTVIPPVLGMKEAVESGFAVTSRELLDCKKIPESLVIIGGGVIGLEFASYFGIAGTKVTVIEMLDHPAGSMDREISAIVQKKLESHGVKFMFSTKVTEITKDGVYWETESEKGETKAELTLVSVGRRVNTAGIGLENIGVTTERGAILTDRCMKTNVPGVYAVGDVNGKLMLAHTAYREAAVAVNNILGKKDTMRYEAIPSVIYTDPEAASVGMSEADAVQAGIEVKTVKLDANYSGRFVAENKEGEGQIKLVAEKKNGRIVGMQFCGTYASEFIAIAAVLIEMNMTVDDAKEIVFPHPTVCEIIREAAFRF